uniref:Uncharacterized protein n=1 Tax=Rhizophora mucronata TaxID=61149 RepID=A0A2P2Q0L3_RHIMU
MGKILNSNIGISDSSLSEKKRKGFFLP